MTRNGTIDLAPPVERAFLIAVETDDHDGWTAADSLVELASLADTAGAVVVGAEWQRRRHVDPNWYVGKGKAESLVAAKHETGFTLLVADDELSPAQQRRLEGLLGVKVIDRSRLILDIFAQHAQTHEGRLQVELAQLEYTYPRLRAMWSHLERIVGGAGGMRGIGTRGPGEQQLEIDRRLVQNRVNDLQRELRVIQARKRREVRERKKGFFTVGIVGYTNAGKSTLFNTLTAGGAYADDRLFATLISRTRQWDLGGGLVVMLSDTVGFVRDLPHNLIASFKATLEEATHADLLLIVLDVSDPAAELHYQEVNRTLDELFREVGRAEAADGAAWREPERILLLNKADRLADNRDLVVWQQRVPGAIPFCALPGPGGGPGLGHDELCRRVRDAVRGEVRELLITLPLSDARAIHTIESQGQVLERAYNGTEVTLRARIGSRQLDALRSAGARLLVRESR